MSNVISFIGRCGRDAEVRTTASGQRVLNLALACDIGYGSNKQTLWLDVAVWGKRAEGELVNWLKKGQQVFVSGELSTREWEDKNRVMKTTLCVNAHIVDLVGSSAESSASSRGQASYGQDANRQSASRHQPPAPTPSNNFNDDVPF